MPPSVRVKSKTSSASPTVSTVVGIATGSATPAAAVSEASRSVLSTKGTKLDTVPPIEKFNGSASFEPAESIIVVVLVLVPPPTPWSRVYHAKRPASAPVRVASLFARISAEERVSDQKRTSLI